MFARGRYGIEFTPPEPRPEHAGLRRVAVAVALVAVVLVVRAVWNRIAVRMAGDQTVEIVTEVVNLPILDSSSTNAPTNATSVPAHAEGVEVSYANRPVKVRNLLLRLAEAERKRDVEMSITTIEQLRATPGAADLDDVLARRLGTLNMRRLFDVKSAQWVGEVTVRRGDSATRIAYEHGSTLASLVKLNGGSVDRLRVGQKLVVMNHPRFGLVVTRRSRTADLSLNGKFFKRYYLTADVKGAEGSYKTPERFRTFCAEKGVSFKPLDRAELEMLLPKGAAAFIKDI